MVVVVLLIQVDLEEEVEMVEMVELWVVAAVVV